MRASHLCLSCIVHGHGLFDTFHVIHVIHVTTRHEPAINGTGTSNIPVESTKAHKPIPITKRTIVLIHEAPAVSPPKNLRWASAVDDEMPIWAHMSASNVGELAGRCSAGLTVSTFFIGLAARSIWCYPKLLPP